MTLANHARSLLVALPLAMLLLLVPYVSADYCGSDGVCWRPSHPTIQYGGLNPAVITSYGTKGYAYFSLTDKTFDASVTYCKNLGYLPYTDQVAKIDGAIVFGDGVVPTTDTFFIGATANDNNNLCTEGLSSGSGWNNNCYYRYLYGFFEMNTYTTPSGTVLEGTAFWQGSYMFTYNSATESSSVVQEQSLNGFLGFNWVYSLAYPLGKLYLAGKKGPQDNSVSRFDTTASPLITTTEDITKRFTTDGSSSTTLDNLGVLCIAQAAAYQNTVTAVPDQPAFTQGWKSLTWLQDHWYVPFTVVGGVIFIILLAVLIVCCLKKTPTFEPLHPMVMRERAGKAYAYGSDEEDNGVHKNPFGAKRRGSGFRTGGADDDEEEEEDGSHRAPGIYRNSRKGSQHAGNKEDDVEMMPSSRGLSEQVRRLSQAAPPTAPEAAEAEEDEEQFLPKTARRRNSRRNKSRVSTNTFSEVDLPQGGEIDEDDVNL